jgi:hypothetical protein
MHYTSLYGLLSQSNIRNSETHMPWRLIIASCIADWTEEIKEMLKMKQVLAMEIENMERKHRAMRYEGHVQLRN